MIIAMLFPVYSASADTEEVEVLSINNSFSGVKIVIKNLTRPIHTVINGEIDSSLTILEGDLIEVTLRNDAKRNNGTLVKAAFDLSTAKRDFGASGLGEILNEYHLDLYDEESKIAELSILNQIACQVQVSTLPCNQPDEEKSIRLRMTKYSRISIMNLMADQRVLLRDGSNDFQICEKGGQIKFHMSCVFDDYFWTTPNKMVPIFRVSTKKAQIVSFPTIPNTNLQLGYISLLATSNSNLPVTFITKTPSVCEPVGSRLILKKIGNCAIISQQAGNDLFSPSDQVLQVFAIVNSNLATVSCIKGKLEKKVTSTNPKCPVGYKLKK
jgi:hypothetical protein